MLLQNDHEVGLLLSCSLHWFGRLPTGNFKSKLSHVRVQVNALKEFIHSIAFRLSIKYPSTARHKFSPVEQP